MRLRLFVLVALLSAGVAGLFLFHTSLEVNPKVASVALPLQDDGKIHNAPLANPPAEIRGIYVTSWLAGISKKVESLIELTKKTDLNAMIIDIKDYSGYISYDIGLPEVKKYKTEDIRIKDIDALVHKLHENNIYAIGRITVFQDPQLALARPDLAVKSKVTGGVWKDKKGLSWMEPGSKEVWDYIVAIAKNVASHGFDEINFDYIRFPSDGVVGDLSYTFWDGKTPKSNVIKSFFEYLRNALPGIKISADLFGYTTIHYDDLGIGQIIENAYENFDYVAPMVYPSHYNPGFLNFTNPGAHPYPVVNHSIVTAISRMQKLSWDLEHATSTASSTVVIRPHPLAKLRPWLQAFDLGAVYTPELVDDQIRAVRDAASSTPQAVDGFMIWNPSGRYDPMAYKAGLVVDN